MRNYWYTSQSDVDFINRLKHYNIISIIKALIVSYKFFLWEQLCFAGAYGLTFGKYESKMRSFLGQGLDILGVNTETWFHPDDSY